MEVLIDKDLKAANDEIPKTKNNILPRKMITRYTIMPSKENHAKHFCHY